MRFAKAANAKDKPHEEAGGVEEGGGGAVEASTHAIASSAETHVAQVPPMTRASVRGCMEEWQERGVAGKGGTGREDTRICFNFTRLQRQLQLRLRVAGDTLRQPGCT